MNLNASNLVFSVPICFMFSCFSALSCNDAVLLFSYFSWWIYLWLQSNLWMISMAAVPSVPQLLLMVSHVLTECMGFYHCLGLPLLPPAVMHWWLATYLVFLHLWLSRGCVWIANLQWIVVVQSYIVFLCCIDGFAIIFFAAYVIGLQHIS